MDFADADAASTDDLLGLHAALEERIQAARVAADGIGERSKANRDDLGLMVQATEATRAVTALLQDHIVVTAVLDRRGVRYPNWKRYNQ